MEPAQESYPPAGTFARDILNRLLIDLSWASSQLEGNTYSRLDTERLIEFGQAAEGKNALETQMILNHKQAIEYLVRDPNVASLSPETVIALHALLSDGLMADPMACGRIRRRAVEIGGSVYMPVALPQRLEELFGIVISMAAEISDPFEQAFFLMVHLPYLQPFEDVNKRVSRLAANIPFIRHNLCPLSFIDVPQQAYVDATQRGVGHKFSLHVAQTSVQIHGPHPVCLVHLGQSARRKQGAAGAIARHLKSGGGQLIELSLKDHLVHTTATLFADAHAPHQRSQPFVARAWRAVQHA